MDLKNIEFIEKNKPAIDEDIRLLNNQIKGILPDVYKEFLKITNGAVLNEYVFYSTKEMIEMYKCHDFSNNMPEYISIGNDKSIATLCVCSIRSSGYFQSSIAIVRYRYLYNHIIFGISITRMFGRFIYLPYCIIIIPYLILVKGDEIKGEGTVCGILL